MLGGHDRGEEAGGDGGKVAEGGKIVVGVAVVGFAEKVEEKRVHVTGAHAITGRVVENAIGILRELHRVCLGGGETHAHEENRDRLLELVVETAIITVVHRNRVHLVDQNVVGNVHRVQTCLEILDLRRSVVARNLRENAHEWLPKSPRTHCRCCGPS